MRRPVWFLHPFHLPSEHAHAIQVIHTCHALAAAGATVRLSVKRRTGQAAVSDAVALSDYGLAPHERLRLEWLPGLNLPAALLLRAKLVFDRRAHVYYARHLRLGTLAARFGSGPTVLELHNIERDTARAVAAAAGIVTVTTALRDEVMRRFGPRAPMCVIPCGADLGHFHPVEGDSPARLVYAGQFQEYKGVDTLIRALAELPGVPALIVGRESRAGEMAALRALAARVGAAERIEWREFMLQREWRALLRGGDIAVLPTRAQRGMELAASPLKLFEYMACGLPIVASDLPSVRDILRDGENAVFFREGDAAALAGAVRRLIGDAALRHAIGAQAEKDATAYSWAERARRILEFIQDVAG